MKEDWYWAADNSGNAGERFVVASGKPNLWSRVRHEVAADERCAWNSFDQDGPQATLADCMAIFIQSREMYGASYNRVVAELAQLPAFAEFIRSRKSDLCNWVWNPMSHDSLPRAPYDHAAEERLGRRIASTLSLDDDWWR